MWYSYHGLALVVARQVDLRQGLLDGGRHNCVQWLAFGDVMGGGRAWYPFANHDHNRTFRLRFTSPRGPTVTCCCWIVCVSIPTASFRAVVVDGYWQRHVNKHRALRAVYKTRRPRTGGIQIGSGFTASYGLGQQILGEARTCSLLCLTSPTGFVRRGSC